MDKSAIPKAEGLLIFLAMCDPFAVHRCARPPQLGRLWNVQGVTRAVPLWEVLRTRGEQVPSLGF